MTQLSIYIGVEAPIELALLSLAIAHARGVDAVVRDEPIEGKRLEARSGSNITIIESRAASFRLSRGGKTAEQPWFLPLNPPRAERSSSSKLRIGIDGGVDSRRLKMSWRTLGALRERGVSSTSMVAGACELPSSLDERPDEVHHALAPAEYLALIDRADVVLECTDSFGTESFLSVAALYRGVAVVAHRDRPDLASQEGNRSAMWSADGFVDALGSSRFERSEPRSINEPLRSLLDFLEGR